MGNILSYLKWRGDISFRERPFCEVDNLLLSELSYLDFSGIVPSPSEVGGITLQDAAALYGQQGKKPAVEMLPPDLIWLAAGSERFRTAVLSNYVDVIDPDSQTQFSALHIRLSDGTTYVAFRGTGDEIVGWREDFSMGYQIMPAQTLAAEYLKNTMTDPDMRYRLGGHSKGGNLAVYAALCCPEEKLPQILEVYSNDGPGLCPEIIDMAGYKRLRPRIVRILPEFSLIGKLFEQDAPDLIVKSSASGAMAHDGATWEIEGERFLTCAGNSEDSRFFNDVFDAWIVSASMEQRAAFTRDFFDALEAGGAKKMSELTASGMDGMESIMIALIRSENRTKIVIGKFVQALVRRIQNLEWKRVLRTKRMAVGGLCFFAGLLVIAKPVLAGKCIGVVLGLAVLFLLGKRSVKCAMQPDADGTRKQWKLSFHLLALCVVTTLLNQVNFISGFVEIILSAGFFWLAYREAKKALCRTRGKPERLFCGLIALLSLLFGILPATVYALEITTYTLTAGTFLLMYGIAVILQVLYQEGKTIPSAGEN